MSVTPKLTTRLITRTSDDDVISCCSVGVITGRMKAGSSKEAIYMIEIVERNDMKVAKTEGGVKCNTVNQDLRTH